ncbi:MAG: carbonic anhydrase [Actinobacteria bacterium]|nr:carbonic anhydrase [Actinomycetota bacterium]MCG2807127.1 carbonic anhydrase [Coriobacteriia bacterium]
MGHEASLTLDRLREGNARFAAGRPEARFSAEERSACLAGQRPVAIVVGCSDSRVPVEAVFDAGPGELFVVRTAGHVLAQASVASIRFALEKLGARLVVVLGHEDCGAVSAALAGDAPEWLAPIVNKIDVSRVDPTLAPADADDALLAAAVDNHVLDTVVELNELIAGMDVPHDQVMVCGGAYKLASGQIHWLG